MPPEPPPLNPSQAVERIREIIVGRHLERLEQRVARLESPAARPSFPSAEDRLVATESKLEALHENLRRIADSTRDESRQREFLQQEEIQRLATQIQQIAASRSAENATSAMNRLEHKLGVWLSTWRDSFHQQLEQRERQLALQLGKELASLRQSTETRIDTLQSRLPDPAALEERFQRIAAAARALAECASAPLTAAPADPSR